MLLWRRRQSFSFSASVTASGDWNLTLSPRERWALVRWWTCWSIGALRQACSGFVHAPDGPICTHTVARKRPSRRSNTVQKTHVKERQSCSLCSRTRCLLRKQNFRCVNVRGRQCDELACYHHTDLRCAFAQVDLSAIEKKVWDLWLDGLPSRREQKAAARLRKSAVAGVEGTDWGSYGNNLSAALLAVTDPADETREEVRMQFSDMELLALSVAEVRDASLAYSC